MNNERSQNKHTGGGEERALRTLRAGLGYGPAQDPKQLADSIVDAQRRRTSVTLAIPSVLAEYFRMESARLGMPEEELMVRILETHQFADFPEQHLLAALARQKQGTER